MKATQIRKGNIIRVDGTLYKIMNMDHVTPGKGRAHIQTKLRNILEGTQTEKRFRSDEDIEKVVIETKEMQYLYNDGDGYHFMDTTTYDQVSISKETLGDAVQYLIPDSTLNLEWFEGHAIGVELPPVVELKVIETPPGVKDATASAQRKPATMETGLVIQVPSFINEGEVIRINTADASYSERAK
ncbi:MAG: elongation factor P [Acidobacteria bacterium]|nr:elongation factor P [Acidobacteriota bacterium]NIM63334.1 elongation factor P [Acidobacteriota bacterium]NIO60518.1 elongation factor P [Acidobacteriota bacterium]NIQ31638.1 elongation factor P [Acidobacteriota bacterium]NIQ87125.1 elongation factor P [Acidobacteriota bacterium]